MKHLDQLCRGAFFLLRYRRGFAVASQTTRLQDYEWLTPWASLSLRRLLVYKTTRLQDGCRMMLRYRFADYKSTSL